MNFKVLLFALASFDIVSIASFPSTSTPSAAIPISMSQFSPFTQFARAAYCPGLQGWECGPACDALPGFIPTVVGGNGKDVPVYFVGYWPAQGSIIVAHEGTDPFQFLSLLVDAEFSHEPLDPTLFRDVPSSVLIHAGFGNAHKSTAIPILAEVKRLIAQRFSDNVVAIGHSLGGALAELDALFLTLSLPPTIKVKGVTYGTPRVGNAPFAQLIDSKVPNFIRINNKNDPIPIVPPPFLNYYHPSGEIHIDAHNNAVSCPGADNTADSQCSNQVVRNVAQGNILDHLGPYDGIYVGIQSCIL